MNFIAFLTQRLPVELLLFSYRAKKHNFIFRFNYLQRNSLPWVHKFVIIVNDGENYLQREWFPFNCQLFSRSSFIVVSGPQQFEAADNIKVDSSEYASNKSTRGRGNCGCSLVCGVVSCLHCNLKYDFPLYSKSQNWSQSVVISKSCHKSQNVVTSSKCYHKTVESRLLVSKSNQTLKSQEDFHLLSKTTAASPTPVRQFPSLLSSKFFMMGNDL